MKYFNSIVRGAATRQGFITNEARITDTTHIQSVSLKIIMTPLFSGKLTDSVNGGRRSISILGTILFWGIHPKNRYAAWPENFFDTFFAGYFQGIDQALHVQLPGQQGIFFSGG